MLRAKGRLDAYTVYLIYSCAFALFQNLISTIYLVYQIEVAKFTPLQLVLAGTALETVAFITQIPTGVLADVYSRRLAVIVGVFITGISYMLQGFIPTFPAIIAGQILYGIGATLTDGAEQAWIIDEVGESNAGRIFIRSSQVALIGSLVAAPLSVALASIRVNIPVVLGGLLIVLLAAFLLFVMPERNFQRTNEQNKQRSWREFAHTFTNGIRIVRARPTLITILLIGLFYGMYSEGFDRLGIAHFLHDFILPTFWHFGSVAWFGFFSVVGTLLSLGATELVRRRVDTNNQRSIKVALFIINAFMVASLLSFALSGNFAFAVVAYLSFGMLRSVNQPLYTAWLAQNIDAKVRATVISITGQVDALGQIIGGPPVGYIGSAFSIRAALVASSILLSPVLLLFSVAKEV